MTKITVFYPLEEQPVPLEGAEDLWLGWFGKSPSDDPLGNFHDIDSFPDIVMDSGYPCPLGDILVDYANGRKETRDTFTIKAGKAETVFSMTDYRVICKDGIWGWEVEAEVTL